MGVGAVIGAVLAFGSFGVPVKSPAVIKAKVVFAYFISRDSVFKFSQPGS